LFPGVAKLFVPEFENGEPVIERNVAFDGSTSERSLDR
jgi:hypothetical protein